MTDKSPLAPLAWSMLTEDSNKKMTLMLKVSEEIKLLG